jgi:hypothetical protein
MANAIGICCTRPPEVVTVAGFAEAVAEPDVAGLEVALVDPVAPELEADAEVVAFFAGVPKVPPVPAATCGVTTVTAGAAAALM